MQNLIQNSKLAKIKKRTGGFSLIEVVIAAGILALSVAAIMALAIYTSHNSDYFLEKTYAVSYASNALELLRSQRHQNLTDASSATIWNSNFSTLANLSAPATFEGKTFSRSVSFQDCSPAGETNTCQQIVSRVTWDRGAVELVTQLTDWKIDS